MRNWLLSCLFLSLLTSLQAQTGGVRGYIRNAAGEPLEYATIYVRETGSGTVANVEGFYDIRLAPGEYTLVYQFLGYEAKVERVAVGDLHKDLNVQLERRVMELATVEVYSNGEDPAYTVMRRAIAKADFHRQQLDYYSAQVYIKGSGRLLRVPGIARRALENEGVEADSTVAYTTESVSEVEYERPNTYRERVISVYTTGEDNGSSPMPFINGSFYEAEIAQVISPLSPRAFGYYRFEMAGYFTDRGYAVNKIKVIPRSRGDNVFEGYIYIIEDLWAIHSLELTTYKLGIRFDINQIYAPIQEQVWLPVTHRFKVTGRVFGFGFDYSYLAAVSNYDIRLNPDLDVDFSVIDEKINRELARTAEARQDEISTQATVEEKLSTGEELTRRDLRQLMREYEREERQEQEEPEIVENRSFEVDSLAYQRDSSYWATVRPIPLTNFEVKGYERIDSLAIAEEAEAEAEADGIKQESGFSKSLGWFGDILTGHSFKLAERNYIHYDGINNLGFNPVEGYWLASRLRYTHRTDDTRFSWSFTPRYGFAWKRMVWRSDANYRFGPGHSPTRLDIGGGRYVTQYNEPYEVNELFNTFYALIGERNFLSLYEKEFGTARWRKTWWSTATLNIRAEWARRRTIRNYTDHTWFDRDDRFYSFSLPLIREGQYPVPAFEKAATVEVDVSWKPWQRYRISNGEREAAGNRGPIFALNYRKGIPNIGESVTDYDRVGLTYRHSITPGA
ncbi:MAG: carboxypeptidase-like regulatory domain-containing protein, partial [Lewinella sp.]|nr:carboxypeptidase-like regulatory domain-containing protein [Lewinella sp.]